MFHRFCAPGEAVRPQGALTPQEFERILLFIGPNCILAPGEWMDRLSRGALEPHHLCITFDDGLRSQFEHALPVLDHLGLKGFWFVYSCVFKGETVKAEIYSHAAAQLGGMSALVSEFFARAPRELRDQLSSPEFAAYSARTRAVAPFYSEQDLQYRFLRNRPENRAVFESLMDQLLRDHGISPEAVASQLWLTDADLRSLAQGGHAIGLHSYDHPYALSDLPRDQQREQYEQNFAHIAAATGQPPRSMSHPLNSYNDDSLTILHDLGIRCGFRANIAPVASRGVNPSPLEIAREDAAVLLSLTTKA